MKKVFSRPKSLSSFPFPFCPGCTYGTVARLIAESIDELGLAARTIGVTSVGCTVRTWKQLDFDMTLAAHGRAPALATGLKRALPESLVFTIQGDGDLAAIGMGETIHCAARCELVTLIFLNNCIFGATGGQQAPTTLIGQKSTSYPAGRTKEASGVPLKMCELLAKVSPGAYIARVSVDTVPNVIKAKKALKKAFQAQVERKGFSMVEFLSACPTNWGMTPIDSLRWIGEVMVKHYPLGEYSTPDGESGDWADA